MGPRKKRQPKCQPTQSATILSPELNYDHEFSRDSSVTTTSSNSQDSAIKIDLNAIFNKSENLDKSKPIELKTYLLPMPTKAAELPKNDTLPPNYIAYTYEVKNAANVSSKLPAKDLDMPLLDGVVQSQEESQPSMSITEFHPPAVSSQKPTRKPIVRKKKRPKEIPIPVVDAILHDHCVTMMIKDGRKPKFNLIEGRRDPAPIDNRSKANVQCNLYDTMLNLLYPNAQWVLEGPSSNPSYLPNDIHPASPNQNFQILSNVVVKPSEGSESQTNSFDDLPSEQTTYDFNSYRRSIAVKYEQLVQQQDELVGCFKNILKNTIRRGQIDGSLILETIKEEHEKDNSKENNLNEYTPSDSSLKREIEFGSNKATNETTSFGNDSFVHEVDNGQSYSYQQVTSCQSEQTQSNSRFEWSFKSVNWKPDQAGSRGKENIVGESINEILHNTLLLDKARSQKKACDLNTLAQKDNIIEANQLETETLSNKTNNIGSPMKCTYFWNDNQKVVGKTLCISPNQKQKVFLDLSSLSNLPCISPKKQTPPKEKHVVDTPKRINRKDTTGSRHAGTPKGGIVAQSLSAREEKLQNEIASLMNDFCKSSIPNRNRSEKESTVTKPSSPEKKPYQSTIFSPDVKNRSLNTERIQKQLTSSNKSLIHQSNERECENAVPECRNCSPDPDLFLDYSSVQTKSYVDSQKSICMENRTPKPALNNNVDRRLQFTGSSRSLSNKVNENKKENTYNSNVQPTGTNAQNKLFEPTAFPQNGINMKNPSLETGRVQNIIIPEFRCMPSKEDEKEMDSNVTNFQTFVPNTYLSAGGSAHQPRPHESTTFSQTTGINRPESTKTVQNEKIPHFASSWRSVSPHKHNFSVDKSENKLFDATASLPNGIGLKNNHVKEFKNTPRSPISSYIHPIRSITRKENVNIPCFSNSNFIGATSASKKAFETEIFTDNNHMRRQNNVPEIGSLQSKTTPYYNWSIDLINMPSYQKAKENIISNFENVCNNNSIEPTIKSHGIATFPQNTLQQRNCVKEIGNIVEKKDPYYSWTLADLTHANDYPLYDFDEEPVYENLLLDDVDTPKNTETDIVTSNSYTISKSNSDENVSMSIDPISDVPMENFLDDGVLGDNIETTGRCSLENGANLAPLDMLEQYLSMESKIQTNEPTKTITPHKIWGIANYNKNDASADSPIEQTVTIDNTSVSDNRKKNADTKKRKPAAYIFSNTKSAVSFEDAICLHDPNYKPKLDNKNNNDELKTTPKTSNKETVQSDQDVNDKKTSPSENESNERLCSKDSVPRVTEPRNSVKDEKSMKSSHSGRCKKDPKESKRNRVKKSKEDKLSFDNISNTKDDIPEKNLPVQPVHVDQDKVMLNNLKSKDNEKISKVRDEVSLETSEAVDNIQQTEPEPSKTDNTSNSERDKPENHIETIQNKTVDDVIENVVVSEEIPNCTKQLVEVVASKDVQVNEENSSISQPHSELASTDKTVTNETISFKVSIPKEIWLKYNSANTPDNAIRRSGRARKQVKYFQLDTAPCKGRANVEGTAKKPQKETSKKKARNAASTEIKLNYSENGNDISLNEPSGTFEDTKVDADTQKENSDDLIQDNNGTSETATIDNRNVNDSSNDQKMCDTSLETSCAASEDAHKQKKLNGKKNKDEKNDIKEKMQTVIFDDELTLNLLENVTISSNNSCIESNVDTGINQENDNPLVPVPLEPGKTPGIMKNKDLTSESEDTTKTSNEKPAEIVQDNNEKLSEIPVGIVQEVKRKIDQLLQKKSKNKREKKIKNGKKGDNVSQISKDNIISCNLEIQPQENDTISNISHITPNSNEVETVHKKNETLHEVSSEVDKDSTVEAKGHIKMTLKCTRNTKSINNNLSKNDVSASDCIFSTELKTNEVSTDSVAKNVASIEVGTSNIPICSENVDLDTSITQKINGTLVEIPSGTNEDTTEEAKGQKKTKPKGKRNKQPRNQFPLKSKVSTSTINTETSNLNPNIMFSEANPTNDISSNPNQIVTMKPKRTSRKAADALLIAENALLMETEIKQESEDSNCVGLRRRRKRRNIFSETQGSCLSEKKSKETEQLISEEYPPLIFPEDVKIEAPEEVEVLNTSSNVAGKVSNNTKQKWKRKSKLGENKPRMKRKKDNLEIKHKTDPPDSNLISEFKDCESQQDISTNATGIASYEEANSSKVSIDAIPELQTSIPLQPNCKPCSIRLTKLNPVDEAVYFQRFRDAPATIKMPETSKTKKKSGKYVPQLDGAADSSSDSSSDEENARVITKRNKAKMKRRKSGKAFTVNVGEPRFPCLNVTIKSSPHRITRKVSTSKTDTSTKLVEVTGLKGTKNVERASKKLHFSNLASTLIEENVECRYKPEVPSKAQHLANASQLNTTDYKEEAKESSTNLQSDDNNENPANENEGSNDSSDLFTPPPNMDHEKDEFIKSSSSWDNGITPYQINQTHSQSALVISAFNKNQNDDDMKKDILQFSSSLDALISEDKPSSNNTSKPALNISDKQEKKTDFELSSSLEALITPHHFLYENTSHHEDLMSIAEKYDLQNNQQPQPGTSRMPNTPAEDIIKDHLKDSPNNKLINILDLTSHLELNESQDTQTLDSTIYKTAIAPKYKPPSRQLIEETMDTYNIPKYRHQAPFYSNHQHVTGAVDVGHNTLKIPSKHEYEEWKSSFGSLQDYQRKIGNCNSGKELTALKLSYCSRNSVFVQPVKKPPSYQDVRRWLIQRKLSHKNRTSMKPCQEVKDHEFVDEFGVGGKIPSQIVDDDPTSPTLNKSSWDNSHGISGVSLNNTHGFKMTLENLQQARSLDIYQYITSLALELHTESRGDLQPDPQLDAIQALFFALSNDIPDVEQETDKFIRGFICVSPGEHSNILTGTGVETTKYTFIVPDELSLYNKFFELFAGWNPDILMGYEIELASWGYLVERGYILGLNVPSLLSRIKNEKQAQNSTPEQETEELHSHLKITGRIVLDLWRILKHEIALQSYTFENLAYHVLHERVPHYSYKDLGTWWTHRCPKYRHRTIQYYQYRVEGVFRLIDHYDLIGRTSELARLFGIQFYEVLSRGSQFRVESMMLRLAKPYKYIPVSPSVQQRAHMKAPEFLPLILEPESKFYKDPVIVLDFQSLYPSMIIAYNYCFSTCLGRIDHLASDAPFEFGAYELEVSRKLVAQYLRKNLLTISPCGVAFVKDEVRSGIMPRMLREILDTRLMVKKSMKQHKGNKTLQKVLHSRQLGLKLIANVTYGYTAANFSGRMPACELADSVVSKGRETLQRAINLVETNTSWGARVIYGDTDSMFVLCSGKSREEAFRIGEEIADAVTKANPSPVRLKLEKVYQPCILQTKKRYVGYMYESADQKEPEFEAKGIETVRRDGCPASSKMLEKCLRLLFDSRDVSQVRNYVLKQFNKIITGRVSIQDLTFAKEYRGKAGYRPGACVPALELTRKWMAADKRKEPRSGERVPYVIINGPPGLPLIKLVRSPRDLLEDPNLRPNALYYITKAIIPPINRCFKLLGADLFNWFHEMPRKQVQYLHTGSPSKGPKSTISQYFATAACASCGMQTRDGLCQQCVANPQRALVVLHTKVHKWERNYYNCRKICESCCARSNDLPCNSLDCPVLYRLRQTAHDMQQAEFVRSLMNTPTDDLF